LNAPPLRNFPFSAEVGKLAELQRRVAKLEKINAVLIDSVERSVDSQGSAYSLFQTTIGLERQVRERTDELTRTLRKLERTNEELVRAKELAELANRSKTRFLAACGHDILQPLNAARLSASALSEVQTSEDGVRLSRQVDRALGTIESLLKALLDISKLDAGVVKPERAPVPLGELLADLESDFAPIVTRKGLKFVVIPTSAWVETDPVMLRRIVQNLVSNAVRYTQSGGVLVGVRSRGEDVRIDVVDTGPGIPLDQHELIFDEFHRGDRANHDGEIGLGLGLSIVQRLVAALGHDVRLKSAVGRGSTFSVTLPRAMPPAPVALEALMSSSLQGYGLSGAFVAVVENDETVREATASLIERWCCDVAAAPSGDELMALVELYGKRPDVILADFHLDHDKTGLEAIERLRQRFDSPIPAIVVTADYSGDTARLVQSAGVELIKKPVKPAELRALLTHLLG